jgi:protein-disulfide isomerase
MTAILPFLEIYMIIDQPVYQKGITGSYRKSSRKLAFKNMSIQLKNAVTKLDHILGIKTAHIELLEYGDFQCSSCGDSYWAVKNAIRELGDSLYFVFRNFPLTDIHPDAFDAALAAEAAALQNKFWEMYNLLFQNQANLKGYELFGYAKKIGLYMERFEQDIQSQKLISKIENEMEGGLKRGVSGTPTFYINGEKYEEDWENDELILYLKTLK